MEDSLTSKYSELLKNSLARYQNILLNSVINGPACGKSPLVELMTLHEDLNYGLPGDGLKTISALCSLHRKQIQNPFTPGFGNINGESLLIGAEAGYSIDDDLSFCLENCFLLSSWVKEYSPKETNILTGLNIFPEYAFHNNPYSYYQQIEGKKKSLGGGHTWRRASKIVPLAKGNINEFFANAYIFDISDVPLKKSNKLLINLSQSRQDFVRQLLEILLPAKKQVIAFGSYCDEIDDLIMGCKFPYNSPQEKSITYGTKGKKFSIKMRLPKNKNPLPKLLYIPALSSPVLNEDAVLNQIKDLLL